MMRRTGRVWTWGLLSAIGLAAGCSCHLTYAPPVAEDVCEAIASVASCSRSHVYVFFVQGHAPCDCASLEALKETVQTIGFPKAWYGACWHAKHFKKEIARIQQADPDARLVLVGYGHGVAAARKLAEAVASPGVTFDLMVCLGKRAERPYSVSRMVTILAGCPGKKGDEDDVHFVDASSHKLPMHPETVDLLANELLGLAGSIPAGADLPKMHYPEKEPTPRPIVPPADASRSDEWDFLKPASAERHTAVPPGAVPGRKKGM